MDIFIVYLRSATDDYENAAVVVAESEEQAIKLAIEESSTPVALEDVDCIRVSYDVPWVYWLM